jgi:hypothetical protein
MLVLTVRSDPEWVYQRALFYFTLAELAEAFAATRGVAPLQRLHSRHWSLRPEPEVFIEISLSSPAYERAERPNPSGPCPNRHRAGARA